VTRRGDRRCFAIVGVLAERGPSTGIDLCTALHRGPGTIYPDLMGLEQQGRVVGYWGDTMPGTQLRRRLYRLATDDERRDHRRRQEQLKAAKQAARIPPLRVVPKPAIGGAA
jgi:DNA-binding PadR family transcriptional regulator